MLSYSLNNIPPIIAQVRMKIKNEERLFFDSFPSPVIYSCCYERQRTIFQNNYRLHSRYGNI